MKRLLLPSALLLALSTFACRDTPLSPTDPQAASRDLLAPNAGGARGVSADLRSRFRSKLRPRFSLSAAASNVDPALFTAILTPGQTASEALTVNLPAAPPKGDVLFLFDLTGSMGGALTNLATNAVDIMSAVSNVIPDVNFGLVSHEDYPGTFASSTDAGQACNYGPTAYGSASIGDLPYRLDKSITSDAPSVVSAIQAMRTKGGADGPEAYSRALYETYADPNIAWRNGARRVVVSFGDNIPHDCNYDFAHVLSASTLSSGVDPGRDNQVGTSDDLGIEDVLDGMKANGITLVTLHNGGVNALWNSYAAVTGGTSFQVNADGTFPEGADPASTIASLISSAVSTVHVLTLEVCSTDAETYGPWLVSTSPASYTDVTLPQSRGFDVVVGPPAGVNLQNGAHDFNLCVMGDGVEYGRQHVTITSEGTTTFVEPGGPGQATIEENGKPVAGIKFPEGTFTEGVTVSVEFEPLPAGATCHDYLLGQTGRCLHVSAVTTSGDQHPILQQPAVVGVCLPADPGPLELFKFEDSHGRAQALQKVTVFGFLDCSGFQTGSIAPKGWFGGLAKRVASWLTPTPLYASHGGFGGQLLTGDGLSFFSWASPGAFSNAGMVANVLNTGKDAFAIAGTFNVSPKSFNPFLGEAGFTPTTDAVTVGFGTKVYTIPANSFKWSPPLKRWVYAAQTSAGVTAMSIVPATGAFTIAATVPTDGPLPAYRAFSIQIGHRAQGRGLVCAANGICRGQVE